MLATHQDELDTSTNKVSFRVGTIQERGGNESQDASRSG